MIQPLKTSVSAHVTEVGVNGYGQLMATVEIKWKALGYEKPNNSAIYYLNLSSEIKKAMQN